MRTIVATRGSRERHRVAAAEGRLGGATALGVGLVLGAGVLYLFAVRPFHGALYPGYVPWWSLIVVFFAAELYVITAGDRSELVALAPHDAVLVLGLFLVAPHGVLAAQLAGSVLALALVRRRRPAAVLFRLGGLAWGTSLAVLVFHGVLSVSGGGGASSWPAAFAAAAVASATGFLLDLTATRLRVSGPLRDRPARALGLAVAGSVSSTSISVAAVELTRGGKLAAALLIVPFAACALALRAYASERRRLEHLRALYESMQSVRRVSGLEAGVSELLAATRRLLDADAARIVLFPSSRSGTRLQAALDGKGETALRPTRLSPLEEAAVATAVRAQSGIMLTPGRAPASLRGLCAELGLREAMLTALRGDDGVLGVLLVGDRRVETGPFTAEDLRLFETYAGHAGVLLENDRLEQSLSELTALKEQLRHQAYHDALTGLPNRRLFAEHVAHALDQRPSGVAVLFLDLDDFKTINDSLGHLAGDELLGAVAGRVRASLRPQDVPARLGGDEFAVLAANATPEEAELIADRLVTALDSAFTIDGREISVHASIGIAYGGRGVGSADELLRNADVAMYDAKQTGKRRHATYAPEMHARVRSRQELATALERAVERGEIGVHFQPIVDLASRRLVALEALARWEHREHGLIGPTSFIPLADEMGMMLEIGSAVLREACRHARAWQAAFPSHAGLVVNVNLAPSELHDPQLAAKVGAVLADTGLAPAQLVLEITESGVMPDPHQALATLRNLRELGVSLALDDFGTGHSSLAYLREFPLDALKIARPFIAGLPEGHVDAVFVDAIVRLASSLGLGVVAEGIEHEAQAESVAALGCSLGQGFYFGEPLSQLGVAGYLAAHTLPEGSLVRVA